MPVHPRPMPELRRRACHDLTRLYLEMGLVEVVAGSHPVRYRLTDAGNKYMEDE